MLDRAEVKKLKEERNAKFAESQTLLAELARSTPGTDETRALDARTDEALAAVEHLNKVIDRADAQLESEADEFVGRTSNGSEVRYGSALPKGASVTDLPGANGGASTTEIGAFFRDSVHGGAEFRAQSEGVGSQGGFLVPTPVSASVWEYAHNDAKTLSEAGVKVMPFDSADMDIAKVDSPAVPVWRAENETIGDDTLEIGVVRANARMLAVIVKASYEVVQDARNLGDLILRETGRAFGTAIDAAVLNGTGTGSQPLGIRNVEGVGSTASVGAIAMSDLSTAKLDIVGNNFNPNAAVMSHREYLALTEDQATTNEYIGKSPYLSDVSFLATNQIAPSGTNFAVVGDFQHAVFAQRTNLEVVPLRERYAENGQIGWLFYARCDVVVMRPGAFHTLEGITA